MPRLGWSSYNSAVRYSLWFRSRQQARPAQHRSVCPANVKLLILSGPEAASTACNVDAYRMDVGASVCGEKRCFTALVLVPVGFVENFSVDT